MSVIGTLLTGISIVLSLFLIGVVSRSIRKFHTPIFKYIMGVFIIILLDSIFSFVSIFFFRKILLYVPFVYILSDLVVLLLFYGAIIRGR